MNHAKHVLLLMAMCCSVLASATHNRAGEITYRHISGNTYEFVVITCTKSDAPADRPFLPIFWGDGSAQDSLERESIDPTIGPNSQLNTYRKLHTFPGPGTYEICMSDPNRNGGIQNIENSILTPFAVKTILRISPNFLPNNSIVFSNVCLQDACLNQPWVFNPGAVDPDGLLPGRDADSLSYKLVKGLGEGCTPLPDEIYVFPNQADGTNAPPNNLLSMDPLTGTIVWNRPQIQGEFNLSFIVEEWRDGFFLGSVLRDMQITVVLCNNQPPVIEAVNDTCIEAGQVLSFDVFADDPDGDNVTIDAFGGPFQVQSSPASLDQPGLLVPTFATFSWATECSHVRLSPYQVTFEATDNGAGVGLVAIETMEITVVAPAPENLVAEAVGSSIALNWDVSPCTEAIGYKIYRRINPYGFVPGPCETGVPAYTGYTLIDTTLGLQATSYLDDDEIIFGRQNCYMVVACFADGAQSYASNEACAEIRFEIPIITKNSVGVTAIAGTDTIHWEDPIELDTLQFPGPYQYRLLRSAGYGQALEEVFLSATSEDFDQLDSTFISPAINTQDTAHTYRVELYSGGAFAARSNQASSLFITLTPDDNRIALSWPEEVPWLNFQYDIYRQAEGESDFSLIGSSSEPGYVDSGLVNLNNYCYYIVSRGSYFAVEQSDTLINFSQRACSQPFDRNPPCSPELSGSADCVAFTVALDWSNPNESCPETDDVTGYNVYFKPTPDSSFTLLQSLSGAEPSELSLQFENSVAGCYAVTALDSLSPWPDGSLVQNESALSNEICFDNCPKYELPNVFTPNGDGRNDFFRPFPYRSIQSVEFTVFNRWGGIVFETLDPDINWNGVNPQMGKIVSDGTYFFTARAFAIRLSGLEPIDLSGYIQVFGSPDNTTE